MKNKHKAILIASVLGALGAAHALGYIPAEVYQAVLVLLGGL